MIIYEVDESKSNICFYVRTLPYPFSLRKGRLSRINASRIHADVPKIGQSRGHFQFQVWNWQGREPHRQSHRVYRQQNVRWW